MFLLMKEFETSKTPVPLGNLKPVGPAVVPCPFLTDWAVWSLFAYRDHTVPRSPARCWIIARLSITGVSNRDRSRLLDGGVLYRRLKDRIGPVCLPWYGPSLRDHTGTSPFQRTVRSLFYIK
jgi:hypothetical protein